MPLLLVTDTNPGVARWEDASVVGVGPTGPQGPQGTSGATGPQGTSGATGPQGPQGFQGAIGAQGAQGFQGPQGNMATYGRSAISGSASLTITTGAVGASNTIIATYEGTTSGGVGLSVQNRVAGVSFDVVALNPVTGSINWAIIG